MYEVPPDVGAVVGDCSWVAVPTAFPVKYAVAPAVGDSVTILPSFVPIDGGSLTGLSVVLPISAGSCVAGKDSGIAMTNGFS